MPWSGGGSGGADGAVSVERKTTSVTMTIASGASLSDAIDMSAYASGEIIMPAAWTAADIGAHTSDAQAGTYQPKYDRYNELSADVSIDGPAAARNYIIPQDWFSAQWLKLWSHDGTGSNTNQGGDRSITLLLKS